MLFNSWEFLIFFVVVLGLYGISATRVQNLLLLGASYFFYGWWDWRFLSLILVSTTVDYAVARRIARLREEDAEQRKRRQWLMVSLVANLGLLATFKYLGFFVDSTVAALEALRIQAHAPVLKIVLPVGISFYTFQTMAYTIDVYRGRVEPVRDPLRFALYVAYFPQLVAGPIERPGRLLPQLAKARRVEWKDLCSGAHLVFIGLVRKVGIADVVAVKVDQIFATPGELSSSTLALGTVLFAVQIYGDFAGYSAIARGVSRMLGIELMENFRWPYFATNITHFWRRWHISLSTWLRDYLYIPLGGNRGPRWFVYRNLMLTMLLGGLWHGASWTFVVWGALHGGALVVHKLWTRDRKIEGDRTELSGGRLPGILASWALTMSVVLVAWIFFRAPTFADAWTVLTGIFAARGPLDLGLLRFTGLMVLWMLVLDVPQARRWDQGALMHWAWPLRGVAYFVFVILMVVLEREKDGTFIYFQF